MNVGQISQSSIKVANYANSIKKVGSAKNPLTSDPSGIQIGERLLMSVKSLEMVGSNLSNGISMLKTADSAIQSTGDVLGRLKALSIQANNGMLSDSDRSLINEEAQQLLGFIEDQSSMKFNGTPIAQGDSIDLAVDDNGGSITIVSPDFSFNTLGLADLDFSTMQGASDALADVDSAIRTLSSQRVSNGSQQRILMEQYDANISEQVNTYEAGSRLTDLDMAQASTELAANGILSDVGIAVQVQANALNSSVLNLLQ